MTLHRSPSARGTTGAATALERGRPERFRASTTLAFAVVSDLGITIATGVSQWDDQSGNARHVTQATDANQPAYNATDSAFKGKPSVQFNGSTSILSRPAVDLVGDYSTFIVLRWSSVAALQYILTNWNGAAGGVLFGASVDPKRIIVHPGVNTGSDAAPVADVTEVVTHTFTSGSAPNLFVNGAAQSLSSAPTTIGASAGAALAIGGVVGNLGAAKVAGITWFSRNLSTSERQRHEHYFGALYGVAA